MMVEVSDVLGARVEGKGGGEGIRGGSGCGCRGGCVQGGCMKFHVAKPDGGWVGGFYCRADGLAEELDRLRDIARLWKSPLVVTRLDNRGGKKGTVYTVEPADA